MSALRIHFTIRLGNWMLTRKGLFRFTSHVDAKTQGRKARWKTWDKVRMLP